MLVLLRSNDLERDPRVNKYINFYKKNKIDYNLVGWNRDDNTLLKENEGVNYYNKKTSYGGGSSNIKNLIFWNIYILKYLFRNRKKYKVIHACDFDTVLPSIIMKLFDKKVIFDIFDVYSDSRDINSIFIKNIIKNTEKIVMKLSDNIIICEEERKKQIGIYDNKIIIIPNIPQIQLTPKEKSTKRSNITLSYVGTLEKNRGIENILEVVSKLKNINLEIAGYGTLEKLVENFSSCYSNINFHGKVKYSDGLDIMKNSDLIVGFYYTASKNNIYAAPNKYYESLFLGKAILTNKGTIFSTKVQKTENGFCIAEGSEELIKFLENIKKIELDKKAKKSEVVWESVYKNYLDETLKKYYLKILGV